MAAAAPARARTSGNTAASSPASRRTASTGAARPATIAQLSATGANGHVVQVVDPAEETFPYSGRIEFLEPEGAGSVTAGRAETWRADYETRVARHRAEIRAETDRLSWSLTIHRTD